MTLLIIRFSIITVDITTVAKMTFSKITLSILRFSKKSFKGYISLCFQSVKFIFSSSSTAKFSQALKRKQLLYVQYGE